MKLLSSVFTALIICATQVLSASADSPSAPPVFSEPLKVGVTAGPHAIIMDFVKTKAREKGHNIKVIEFNDFVLPNKALNDKELDVNCYQHKLFLDEQNKSMGYQLVSVGKTVTMPLGLYPGKTKAIDKLEEGAQIAIPNDPTNGGRALLLLQKAALITLKENPNPTVIDIADNAKKLKIIELEAPQLPRSLEDVDMAVINTDWVFQAKLDPTTAILKEDKNSPYANIIAARKEDEERADVIKFVSIYHSDDVKNFIQEEFKGAVLPAW